MNTIGNKLCCHFIADKSNLLVLMAILRSQLTNGRSQVSTNRAAQDIPRLKKGLSRLSSSQWGLSCYNTESLTVGHCYHWQIKVNSPFLIVLFIHCLQTINTKLSYTRHQNYRSLSNLNQSTSFITMVQRMSIKL